MYAYTYIIIKLISYTVLKKIIETAHAPRRKINLIVNYVQTLHDF